MSAAQGQAYQRGNQIQQAYGQRGLANSGLAQYGQIANRQAMGQTVNQLAGQNAEVARAAMDASKGISQNLQNTLMRARLQSDAQSMETDQNLYAQEKGEQESQFQRALQYMDLMGIDPSTDAGKAIMNQLFQGQVGGDLQAQIDAAANAPVDLLETSGVRRDMSNLGKASGAYLDWYTSVFGGSETGGALSKSNITYTINGQKVTYKGYEAAQEGLTKTYANKQYIANGQVKIYVNPISGKVSFIDQRTGGKSKTYNDAVNKLKGV